MDAGIIILFAAVLIVGAILFAVITFGKRGGSLDVEKYRVEWLRIEQSIAKDNEGSLHMAIINADKLVDQALRDKGVAGQTMGDRLKVSKGSFSQLDALWNAHKLRNKIAHEPNVTVGYDQTRKALASFKRALKDLGAI